MKKLLLLPALFLFAACNDVTSPTALAPASRLSVSSERTQDVPLTFTACNGEPVNFLGTFTIREIVNGGGQSTSLDYHGNGIGDITGAHYAGRLTQVDKQAGNASNFTLRLQVSGGGGKPFILDIFAHYALNPQGLPGASFEHTRTTC